MFAAEIRKQRVHHRSHSQWRWHLDEVFVRINGETHYLWRAVDHEGASSARVEGDAALLEHIREAHAQSYGTYGAPRIQAELAAKGICVARKRIARLMRTAGLAGGKPAQGATHDPAPGGRAAERLSGRWPVSQGFCVYEILTSHNLTQA